MTVKPAAQHYKYITAVRMFLSRWANTEAKNIFGVGEGNPIQHRVQGVNYPEGRLWAGAEPSTKYFLGDTQGAGDGIKPNDE